MAPKQNRQTQIYSPNSDYINRICLHDSDFSCCGVTDIEIYKYFTHIDNIAKINDIKDKNGNNSDLLKNLYSKLPCPVKTQSFCKKNIESTFKYKLTRKHTKNATDKWVTCTNTETQCENVMKAVINMEVQSTAYYLRLLVNSIIYNNSTEPLQLQLAFNPNSREQIVGVWRKDKNIFIINGIETEGEVLPEDEDVAPENNVTFENNSYVSNASNASNTIAGGGRKSNNARVYIMPLPGNITYSQQIKPRLIMGFGPSASNKPHLINDMIKIFKQADKAFPDKFISIDDKIIRKISMVYNIILTCIDNYNQTYKSANNKSKQIKGFKNLINNIKNGEHALFPSTEIKDNFATYLLTHYKDKVSLYVAATLCKNMQVDVDPYVNITGDTHWNGMLIWQHQSPKLCTFKDEYKCNNNINNPFATDQDYRNRCNQFKQNEEYAVQIQFKKIEQPDSLAKKPIEREERKAKKLRELRKVYRQTDSPKDLKYREDCEENKFSLLREQYEDAMFTVKDWRKSMHNGKHFLHKAPGYRLKIHSASNTATDTATDTTNKSIIKDYTKYTDTLLQQEVMAAFKKYKSFDYCYNNNDNNDDTDENDYDESNSVKKCTQKCDKYYKNCANMDTATNSSLEIAVQSDTGDRFITSSTYSKAEEDNTLY